MLCANKVRKCPGRTRLPTFLGQPVCLASQFPFPGCSSEPGLALTLVASGASATSVDVPQRALWSPFSVFPSSRPLLWLPHASQAVFSAAFYFPCVAWVPLWGSSWARGWSRTGNRKTPSSRPFRVSGWFPVGVLTGTWRRSSSGDRSSQTV